jgi:hypothetical protein
VPERGLGQIAVIIAFIAGTTLLARLLGYRVGGRTVVRCRQGHLFTTVWIPGVKLKALDLGVARFQHCPVGHHWTLISPVREGTLTTAERRLAAQYREVPHP